MAVVVWPLTNIGDPCAVQNDKMTPWVLHPAMTDQQRVPVAVVYIQVTRQHQQLTGTITQHQEHHPLSAFSSLALAGRCRLTSAELFATAMVTACTNTCKKNRTLDAEAREAQQ
jgi:hypothetical protein